MKTAKNNPNDFILKEKNFFNKIKINPKKENIESENSFSDNNNEEETKINIKEIITNKKINLSLFNNSKNKNKLNDNSRTLPSLIKSYKDENLENIKKISLSSKELKSTIIEEKNANNNNEKKKLKKSKIIDLINELDNKIKYNSKTEAKKKINYELEQDKQACKLITLTLPEHLKYITKTNKIQKNKMKSHVMHSLINSYRAKLYHNTHSPDEKIGINKEILDKATKKITQAFGRTSYNYYFKKGQLDNLNINKNINNFTSSNSKRNYKC